jgi:hypothetical protein
MEFPSNGFGLRWALRLLHLLQQRLRSNPWVRTGDESRDVTPGAVQPNEALHLTARFAPRSLTPVR